MKESILSEDQNMSYSVRCFQEVAKMNSTKNYIINLEFRYKLKTENNSSVTAKNLE